MIQRTSSLGRFFALFRISVFGLLLYSSVAPAEKKPPAYDDPEGYAVLSLLLSDAGPDIHSQAINISALTAVETLNGMNSLEKCVKIPNEFREAADDYLQKTKSPYLFQEKFNLKMPYRTVVKRNNNNDHKHLPKTNKEISDRISGGTFFLSAVGFETHTHAIVFKNYICGSLCGWGSYHLLVKGKDGWKEANGVGGCVWQY